MIKNVKLASEGDLNGGFGLLMGTKEEEKQETGKNRACIGTQPRTQTHQSSVGWEDAGAAESVD